MADNPTFLSTFDGDLMHVLTEMLRPSGVAVLECCCGALRRQLDEYWLHLLHTSGFADELAITDAHLTVVARRVVLSETRRRETFPSRLIAALGKLGLSDAPTESELRYLQYRHGLLLDRRYARAARRGELDSVVFHADTLPGASEPSNDVAATRVRRGYADSRAARRAPMRYPQRAAFLPLTVWQATPAGLAASGASGGMRRKKGPKLEDALRSAGLGPEDRPRLEELADGRDIELCAFAPVMSSPTWNDVFSPEPFAGLAGEPPPSPPPMPPQDPWDYEADPSWDPVLWPERARFEWQLVETVHGPGRGYHRMAIYTCEGGELRTATAVERQRCASLVQHGLRPAPLRPVAPAAPAAPAGGAPASSSSAPPAVAVLDDVHQQLSALELEHAAEADAQKFS